VHSELKTHSSQLITPAFECLFSAKVLVFASIDPNPFSDRNKQRYHNLSSGGEDGGFATAGGSISFDSGIGLCHFQDNRVGQFHFEDLVVPAEDIDFHAFREVFDAIAYFLGSEGTFLVSFHIHKDELVALFIGMLHSALFQIGLRHSLASPEGVLYYVSGLDIFEFCPHESRAFSWLDVEEFNHPPHATIPFNGNT